VKEYVRSEKNTIEINILNHERPDKHCYFVSFIENKEKISGFSIF
jgi:hypothetical protein